MLKTSDLRQMSVVDLKAKTKDMNEDIFKLKMQKAMGSVTDKLAVRKMKRELAQVMTIINEKSREGVK